MRDYSSPYRTWTLDDRPWKELTPHAIYPDLVAAKHSEKSPLPLWSTQMESALGSLQRSNAMVRMYASDGKFRSWGNCRGGTWWELMALCQTTVMLSEALDNPLQNVFGPFAANHPLVSKSLLPHNSCLWDCRSRIQFRQTTQRPITGEDVPWLSRSSPASWNSASRRIGLLYGCQLSFLVMSVIHSCGR